jgi:hypothetical protein
MRGKKASCGPHLKQAAAGCLRGFALERMISERSMATMSQHVLHEKYVEVLPMLGTALLFLWLMLAGVRQRCAQAALTVTGYLRPRPARSVEDALRTALAELDRDLAALLGDRNPSRGGHR